MMNLFANTYRLHWVIASTSILLAIKINEEIDPEVSKITEQVHSNINTNANNANNTSTVNHGIAELGKSQILAMERRITLLLDWHLNPPTPKTLCHALMDSFPCPLPFPFKYRIAQMVEHLFLDHIYMSPDYYEILLKEGVTVVQLIGEVLAVTLELAAVKDQHWTLIIEKLLNCKLNRLSCSVSSEQCYYDGNALIKDCIRILNEMEGAIQIITG